MANRLVLITLVLAAVLPVAHVRANDLPDQAYISGVVGHAQEFSLSCEARSAADWANYWGVFIGEVDFLDRLPRSDNPDEGFVGSPSDPWGYIPPSSYGVHADPVAKLLRNYGLEAHAGHNLSWDELRTEIAAGRPAIVWVIGSIWAGRANEIETRDGQTVIVANNEHTMILIGYDPNSVQLVDALTGYTVSYALDNFLTSWSVLGNMAVTGEGVKQSATETLTEGEPADAYTVQPGDTLGSLANDLSLAWIDLAAWNNIRFPYLIYPGQQLMLTAPEAASEPAPTPEAGTQAYTVQRGDTLMKIARALELDWTALAEVNELTPPYLLYPGDILKLPGDDAPAEETNAPIVPEFYTAEGSESLFALAHYYELDWIVLAAINDISYPYMLSPGQTIRMVP